MSEYNKGEFKRRVEEAMMVASLEGKMLLPIEIIALYEKAVADAKKQFADLIAFWFGTEE